MKQKGFTLIELLVVVAIIGILAAVGVVAYNGYTSSAKIRTLETNYVNIERKILNSATGCLTGMKVKFGPYQGVKPDSHTCNTANMEGASINADTITYRTYLEMKGQISNPYDKSKASIVWSNGSCPPQNVSKGQIGMGYAQRNNSCGMAGNISCIKVNLGDINEDGSDDYLSNEVNFCEF